MQGPGEARGVPGRDVGRDAGPSLHFLSRLLGFADPDSGCAVVLFFQLRFGLPCASVRSFSAQRRKIECCAPPPF
eukprot:15890815-Heterocapsa_arctica.AAC.1